MMRKFSDVPHHEKVVHTYHIPSTFKSSIQNGPPAYFTVAVDFGHPIFVQNVRKKTERGGKTHQCKKSKQNSSSATLNIRESHREEIDCRRRDDGFICIFSKG